MNIEKFEAVVVNLANRRVQEKLDAFNKAIRLAFEALTCSRFLGLSDDAPARQANMAILKIMFDETDFHPKKGWPRFLWEREEGLVREELFETMDIVQRALLAPLPSAEDRTAAEEGDDK